MNPMRLLRMMRTAGKLAEPTPPRGLEVAGDPAAGDRDPLLPAILRGSAQVRHVDVGSCNGCEIELAAAFGPVYDVERYGARLVASPRHADVVLVTGVVTQNMKEPLLRTVEATPRPRVVLAVGDCARNCGMFAGAYGVVGSVGDVVPVDLEVPGCPPPPEAIVEALRRVTRR
ncbi:MAG: NADH-quinone oxidoreductase subunit NuoB [Lapillicoccus sp.]